MKFPTICYYPIKSIVLNIPSHPCPKEGTIRSALDAAELSKFFDAPLVGKAVGFEGKAGALDALAQWQGCCFGSPFNRGWELSHFWEYWTSPEKVAIKKTIYRFWLGDVQWGHLMTHVQSHGKQNIICHQCGHKCHNIGYPLVI